MSRKSQTTRRSVLTATGAVSLLGLAGVASGNASGDSIPVPDDADERTYPTIGTNSDAPTATFYGNFKCPSSRGFVSGNLQDIVSEFVTEGLLNVEFCTLAYEPGDSSQYLISASDPRLAAVGLAVWDEDPGSYWQFVTETYSDMPSGHISYDELESRARAADVTNAEACIERAQAGEYDAAVEQVAELAGNDSISFTPQLELAGDTTAPHHGTQAVLDWIDARLEDAPNGEKSEEKVDETDEEEAEVDDETDDEAEVDDETDDEAEVDEADDEDEESGEAEETEDDPDVEEPQEEADIEDVEESEPAEEADEDDSNDEDDSDEDDTDDTDSDDVDTDDTDDTDPDDGGETSSGSSGSSSGIGAGEDYDLSSDRTVDDLPVDC